MKCARYIVAFGVLAIVCAGSVPADAQGGPGIQIRIPAIDWTDEVSVESNPVENVFLLQLGNTSDTQQTYHFQGPMSDDGWQVQYFVSGSPRSNEFDLTLDADETETVTVEVTEQGVPDHYFLGTFSFGSGADVAEVHGNLVVPADVMVQAAGQTSWVGDDFVGGSADQTASVVLSPGQSGSFTVKLQNVQNASVSYALRACLGTNEPLIVRCYDDGSDITGGIFSGEGYRTDVLYPGEELNLSFTITPVGTDTDFWDAVVTARVAQIYEPALNLTPVYNAVHPFALHVDNLVEVGEQMIVYAGQQLDPGFFGLLNYDGGSHGTGEIIDWILNGYLGGIVIDPEVGFVEIQGGTGLRPAIDQAVEELIGEEIVVAVYDQVSGHGHNTSLRVIGFIVGTLIESTLDEGGYIIVTMNGWLGALSRSDAVGLGAQLSAARIRTSGWHEVY